MAAYGRPPEGPAYGLIPESEYLRKIELTNFEEDENDYENYVRSQLVDFRPDETNAIEAYEPRDPNDRGGGNHSAEKLSVLHSGLRTSELPYLPDGTFLDFEFTNRDPRGVQNLPNFRDGVKQAVARAPFIKFYDDSDNSVPESAINPVQMEEIRRKGFYAFKENFKNFDESKKTFHTGGTTNVKRTKGDLNLIDTDAVHTDLSDASVRNRLDAVGYISNDPTRAFRYSTPDHRVKIARYGLIKAQQPRFVQDWDNNRRSTFQDDAKVVPINGINVNRMLANLIVDIEGQRLSKQEVAKGANYNDSYANQIRSHKIAPDDIIKILLITGSQPKTAHESFDGKQIRRYTNTSNPNNRVLLDEVQVNHVILNSMEQVNRIITNQKKSDLRNHIEETAIHSGIFKEVANARAPRNRNNDRMNSEVMRDGLDTRHIEDSRTIVNYGFIKPTHDNSIHDKLSWEKFGDQSLSTRNTVHQYNKNALNLNNLDNDQDQLHGYNDFGFITPAPIQRTKGNSNNYGVDFGDTEKDDTFGHVEFNKMYSDMMKA